jgi:hypothetical protein
MARSIHGAGEWESTASPSLCRPPPPPSPLFPCFCDCRVISQGLAYRGHRFGQYSIGTCQRTLLKEAKRNRSRYCKEQYSQRYGTWPVATNISRDLPAPWACSLPVHCLIGDTVSFPLGNLSSGAGVRLRRAGIYLGQLRLLRRSWDEVRTRRRRAVT